MKQQKSLGTLVVLNSVNTVLGMLFPLVTYPYVTRVLGAENLGKVNFGSSVISYFAIIAALGVYTYATREGAIYRENREKFCEFSSEIFTINIISTLIAYGLLVICLACIAKFQQYMLLLIIQSLTIFFTTIGVPWIYVIYEDYLYIVVRNILFQILSLILLFVLVRDTNDYIMYAIITVISNGGSSIFNLIHSRKYVDLKLKLSKKCFLHIKSILYMFASTIASTIYVNSDNIILGFVCGDIAVGLYSISVKIYTILKTLVYAIYGVELPRITLQLSKNERNEVTNIINFITSLSFFLVIPIIVGINMLCKEAIVIVGGNEFIDATLSLRILMMAFVFSIFASLFSTLILLPEKQEITIMKASFISGILNIVLNLFFIKIWKQNGAAITTLISEITVCIIYYKASERFLNIKFDYKEIMKILISSLGMIPIWFFIKLVVHNLYIRTVITIIFCGVMYIGGLFVLKSTIIEGLYKNIKNKLKR